MESVRLRLVFEDRHILCKSQRKQGLRRSWILLKPQHGTISDVASDLLHSFQLHSACPRGVILSMDGFVLPPFEPTSLLKDRDVVCVKKKGGSSHKNIKWDGKENALEELEFVEKQPVHTNVLLLANEEFKKEAGGYESESEEDERELSTMNEEMIVNEDATSKKRKASKKIKSPKKKKRKFADAEEPPVVLENAVNDKSTIERGSHQEDAVLPEKSSLEKDKSSHKQRKRDESSTAATAKDDGVAVTPECQPPEKAEGIVDASHTPDKPKLPSRNARRKKAKRKWLAEMKKIGNKPEAQRKQPLRNDDWRRKFLGSSDQTLPFEDHAKSSEKHENMYQNDKLPEQEQPHDDGCDNDDIVPVVIRPGHIKFGAPDKVAGLSVERNQVQMNVQWNGITSKKKGQKWGTEKLATKWTIYEALNEESAQEAPAEKEMQPSHDSDLLKFNELSTYGPFPREGDIVAYRVIELSSSWTPEVSPFRVGKISSCKGSSKIVLVPVPEYPFDMEKIDKSLYGEDGSLEVDFSALVDVRSVKTEKMDSAQPAGGQAKETAPENSNAARCGEENNKGETTPSASKENGEVNVWEEISQALSAKKAQLSQEDRWNRKEQPGRASSIRVARGGALGPIMALLRAQNGI